MWGQSEDEYDRAYGDHEASLGHELIAGGAAFAGFKMFEDHQRREGKPVSHAFAKELLAGFVGAEADKLAETRGEEFIDRERARWGARQRAERMYDDHYIEGHRADGYDPRRYGPPEPMTRREEWKHGW